MPQGGDGYQVGEIARDLVQRVGFLQGGQQRNPQASDPRVVQLSPLGGLGGQAAPSPSVASWGKRGDADYNGYQHAQEAEYDELLPAISTPIRGTGVDEIDPASEDFWADFSPRADLNANMEDEDGWRGLVRKAGGAVRPLYENAVEAAQSTAKTAAQQASAAVEVAQRRATQAKEAARQADGSSLAAGAAALGQQVLEAAGALSQTNSPTRDGAPPPPVLQQSHAEVPSPATEREWAECLRDLERMLQGDGVYIAGQHRLSPVSANKREVGDVGRAARAAAFDELLQAIQRELQAQGESSPVAMVDSDVKAGFGLDKLLNGPSIRAPKPKQRVRQQASPNVGTLRELARRVAAHLSVGPGMQVTLQNGLPPALWQPTFLLCIGGGQVRVLTFAFIGEPVTGDRPDCKSTPFVLRMVTEDLLPGARQAAAGIPTPWRASVRCDAETVTEGARFMLEHIASVEEDLFKVAESGEWDALFGKAAVREKEKAEPKRGNASHSTSFASATYGLGGL